MIRSVFLRATLRPHETGSAPAASAAPVAFRRSRRVVPPVCCFFIPLREEFITKPPTVKLRPGRALSHEERAPERGLSASGAQHSALVFNSLGRRSRSD